MVLFWQGTRIFFLKTVGELKACPQWVLNRQHSAVSLMRYWESLEIEVRNFLLQLTRNGVSFPFLFWLFTGLIRQAFDEIRIYGKLWFSGYQNLEISWLVEVWFPFLSFSSFSQWKFKLCCFTEYEILARVPIILNKYTCYPDEKQRQILDPVYTALILS